MPQQPPTIQTMKVSDLRQNLAAVLNQIFRGGSRVLVEKSGIPVAGIVSAADLERLDRLDRERAERFKVLDEFAEAFKDVPYEELEREVERTVAEVRAEMRTERRPAAGVKA